MSIHAPIVEATPSRTPHPVVYTILIAPFGAVSGYVMVAMAYLATRPGNGRAWSRRRGWRR